MNINTVISVADLSNTAVLSTVKNAVVNEMDLSGMVQVDSYKWVIPVECDNGSVMYAEIAVTCKKEGYDVEKAHNDYMDKVERAEKREQERRDAKREKLNRLMDEMEG